MTATATTPSGQVARRSHCRRRGIRAEYLSRKPPTGTRRFLPPDPAPVRGRLAQRLRQAEVNEVGLVQIDRVLPPAIVGVHKPDPVRQFARHHRRMKPNRCGLQLTCYHAFDNARNWIEIPCDTPSSRSGIVCHA
jgi:hypothetical protein